MKHPSGNERGQAIVILALMMIVLLAFAALAIDGGNAYVERRRAQNAADAAALAGARQLWVQTVAKNSSWSTLLAVINQAAVSNGIAQNAANGSNVNVVAKYTDKSGNLLSENGEDLEVGLVGIPPNAMGIQVQASRQFNTFVGGLLKQSPAASAQATAVVVVPPPCGHFAIYASGVNVCSPADVEISGGGQGININQGGVYSAGSLKCDTGKAVVGPPPDNVWQYNVGPKSNECASVPPNNLVQQGPAAPPIAWVFSDFAPTGTIASALGNNYHHIIGNLDGFPSGDGLYYVEGDVSFNKGTIQRVTVVSTGQIQGSGGCDVRAYYGGLLFFSNAAGTTGNGAVRLTGSDMVWQGLIYAPYGSVDMHGARNVTMGGSIYCLCVNMSGAEANITYDPASCPPQRATIELLK